MDSTYFDTFYPGIVPETLINELLELIPEPEEEWDNKVSNDILEVFNSYELEDYNILVKFWIMSGLSSRDLLKLIPYDEIDSNGWDWIHWDAKMKGDSKTLSLISEVEERQIKQTSLQRDFELWEHWILKFDPNFKNSEEIRNKAYDELTDLSKKTKIQYFPLYELYTELQKENVSIPDEKHIVVLDKILSNPDWKMLGSFWQSIALYEFARIQADFSDISGSIETIQEVKNISWQNPYFLGLLLRLEAKLSFIQKRYEEMDHLIQSSLFFFQKIDNKREIIYTRILQSNYWSITSKEKAMKALTEISKDTLLSIKDHWLEGYFYSNLANFYSADPNSQESCQYFNQSATLFSKTIDKLKYYRNSIDYGFNLYTLKKFDEIPIVIENLKEKKLPTMYEFRVAYLNAITHYRTSNIKEAIQLLEGSIQEAHKVLISPHLPWFYSLLAEIYRVQGKWIIVIDYLNLAMKSYFHLNETDNASRAKLAISLHYFLIDDSKKAIDTANDIAVSNGIDPILTLEVYWVIFKYFLFSSDESIKIENEILNKLDNLSKQVFSSEFYEFFKQMVEFLSKLGKNNIKISELVETIRSKFDSIKKSLLEKEWTIELRILLKYFALNENELIGMKYLDFMNEISIHKDFSYPKTANLQKLNDLLNNVGKDKTKTLEKEKISEIQNALILVNFEINIYRIISPIFPLKLY